MTNEQHITKALAALEKRYGKDAIYDLFSGIHDAAVYGHTSESDDNPYDQSEQPAHDLYRLGAETIERARKLLG